jgi:hypothetical protein
MSNTLNIESINSSNRLITIAELITHLQTLEHKYGSNIPIYFYVDDNEAITTLSQETFMLIPTNKYKTPFIATRSIFTDNTEGCSDRLITMGELVSNLQMLEHNIGPNIPIYFYDGDDKVVSLLSKGTILLIPTNKYDKPFTVLSVLLTDKIMEDDINK